MSWVATAVVGSAVIGAGAGIYSSNKQSEAIGDATQAQLAGADAATQAELDMYYTSRGDILPFLQLGAGAQPYIDYLATGSTDSYDYEAYNLAREQYRKTAEWNPSNPSSKFYLNGPVRGVAPSIEDFKIKINPKDAPQQLNTENYIAGLQSLNPELNVNFNPDDPIYQFQLQEKQKAIDKALASQGKYFSGERTDAYGRAAGELAMTEVDRQYARTLDEYNRKYGQLSDLYNLSTGYNNQQYGRLLDLVKIGSGASQTAGQYNMAAGQTLAGIQTGTANNLSNLQIAKGQNQADLITGLATLPMNAYATYNMISPSSLRTNYTNPSVVTGGGYTGYQTPSSYYYGSA